MDEKMISLMELFGLDTAKEEKAPEKKNKKARKSSEKKKEEYRLPISVFVGAVGKVCITESDTEKETLTPDEIRSIIGQKILAYPENNTDFFVLNGVLEVTLKNVGIEKGVINAKSDVKMFYGNEEIEISDCLNESMELTTEALKKSMDEKYSGILNETTKLSFLYDEISNRISVLLDGPKVDSVPLPEEKITFYLESGEIISVDGEEIRKADGNKDDEAQVSVAWQKYLPEEFSAPNFYLTPAADKDSYIVIAERKKADTAVEKKDVYKVDQVTLSLLYVQYKLTKEDFGGRAEVPKEDIIKYVINKGHREFSVGKVNIEWSEKFQMIVLCLQGSKKGAAGGDFHHPCFELQERDGSYIFYWSASRIPRKLWYAGLYLARTAYQIYGSEILMDLYLQPKVNRFAWFVPDQVVRPAGVSAAFEPFLQSSALSGLVKVGQFHSHGKYEAFFSGTDNQDEVQPGIYGVWGKCNKSIEYQLSEPLIESVFTMRCVLESGKYIQLTEFGNVFESDGNYFDTYKSEEQNLKAEYLPWMKKIRIAGGNGEGYPTGLIARKIPCAFLCCRAEADFLSLCKNVFLYSYVKEGSKIYLFPEQEKNLRQSVLAVGSPLNWDMLGTQLDFEADKNSTLLSCLC